MKPRTALFYGVMLAAAVGVFFWIRSAGESLVAPVNVNLGHYAKNAPSASISAFTHVLLALVVIILCARGLGTVFARFNQPPVIGEMIAGILLGPSLLGRLAPGVFAYLLPNQAAPYLSVIANIGVILYMFLVGVELNTKLLRDRTHASVATSHASIIVPFLLGSALALWLYPLYSTSNIRFAVFALFMGISMSVTAFPVLARVITDRGMQEGQLATIALACAAVDDVTAWCLFALVVSVARAHAGRVLITLGLTAGFIFAIFVFVRPAAAWFVRRHARREQTVQSSIVVACVALLLAALTTQWIGIHALFGAFLVGSVIPYDSRLARDIKQKFEDLVVILFLPTFFAFTGLRTQIGLVHGLRDWVICAVIIAVASLGKFGGAAVAARLTGLDWRQAGSLGILMNTRGLMELIVLNVGLDLGVLSPTLFAMLVIMAIVTTLATTPVLQALARESEPLAVREKI
ncbi:MAG TPA: cation:proton antiporter [Candidatus Acidoferrales bacterium]|nr:cation:proton antiporter [Candidatus Acidoferrales bacterium]